MCQGLFDIKTPGVVCHLGNVGLKNDGSEKRPVWASALGIDERHVNRTGSLWRIGTCFAFEAYISGMNVNFA